ncbi:MAG: amino acid permease, partial [Nitrospiraceae bacterium]|nr:amino acid permease [Nitrospiraceae bacterium]
LFQVTMMGLGMMIGAGVFLGIGNSIYITGPGGVILTFALNGMLALFTAMSYAELSSAIPKAGGTYNFARIGFGKGISFISGWTEWFASSVAGSMYAVTFSIYTMRYFEQIGMLGWVSPDYSELLIKVVAAVIALFFIYINYRGASETGKVGALMTVGQTAFMVFIGVMGIIVAIRDPSRLENFKPFLPNGWSKLLITMGFTYVAFEGYEVIAQAGDETINPRENLPKAMLYSVFIVCLTYITVAFATIVAVKAGSPGVTGAPWQWIGSFREKGFGEAVARLIPAGNFLLTLAVIFSSTSALNATIYSATRTSYALGRDGMLPPLFSKISKRRKTPANALAFTSVIIISLAVFLPIVHVASSASIMFLFLFFIVNLSVIKIRYNMGDELNYGFLSPFFPVFPVLAIILQAALAIWLVKMSLIAWIVAPTWIGLGILTYFLYSKKHASSIEGDIRVLEEEEAPESGDAYRVMIPIANPDNAFSLISNTIRICGKRRARIELLHMVSVPDQVPLTDARKYITEGREGIVEAMLYLRPRFPITTSIRYGRNVARGIVSAVREKKIDLLIMGWHGNREDQRFNLGSIIDPVVNRSPSDIIILKDCANKSFKNILVPLYGDYNDIFSLETAAYLLDPGEGKITVLYLSGNKKQHTKSQIESLLVDMYNGELDIELKVSTARDKVRVILNASRHFDLVVIGIEDRFLTHFGILSSSEIIAGRCLTPLALVKSSRKIISWTKRWI